MSEQDKCWQGWDAGKAHRCLCNRKKLHDWIHVCSCGETK